MCSFPTVKIKAQSTVTVANSRESVFERLAHVYMPAAALQQPLRQTDRTTHVALFARHVNRHPITRKRERREARFDRVN